MLYRRFVMFSSEKSVMVFGLKWVWISMFFLSKASVYVFHHSHIYISYMGEKSLLFQISQYRGWAQRNTYMKYIFKNYACTCLCVYIYI